MVQSSSENAPELHADRLGRFRAESTPLGRFTLIPAEEAAGTQAPGWVPNGTDAHALVWNHGALAPCMTGG